jgi:shikimate dehydrogenase
MMKKNFSDNELCISIAERPGKYGTVVHNAGFKALGLNFYYKAFGISNVKGAIQGVRALGIRGCSVSMPFKEKVIPLLDELDSTAKKVKAVNTIVNDNGYLIGYNTDVIGIKKCLQELKIRKNKKIILLGSGGVARAILVALKDLKFNNITVSNRTLKKGKSLSKEFDVNFIEWSKRNIFQSNIIINATSIGMFPNVDELPISEKNIKNVEIVIDFVASPPNTKLIQCSKKFKTISIAGSELALNQAYEQFRLYTGKKPPVKIMKKAVKDLLSKK